MTGYIFASVNNFGELFLIAKNAWDLEAFLLH
jgi:hypothetical protein